MPANERQREKSRLRVLKRKSDVFGTVGGKFCPFWTWQTVNCTKQTGQQKTGWNIDPIFFQGEGSWSCVGRTEFHLWVGDAPKCWWRNIGRFIGGILWQVDAIFSAHFSKTERPLSRCQASCEDHQHGIARFHGERKQWRERVFFCARKRLQWFFSGVLSLFSE